MLRDHRLMRRLIVARIDFIEHSARALRDVLHSLSFEL
jgi:hypothetical protein